MFGYGFDKRMIYGILAILVIYSVMGMTRDAWLSILLTLPSVIIAITIHEFSHAKAADMLGDKTPRSQGRLTLNPLCHLDPMGFVLLMFAHIGWGKPVQINPNNFTSNKSKGECEAIVSLAGPASNFILAFLLIIVDRLLDVYIPNFGNTFYSNLVVILLDTTVVVNIGLGVFNLIPLPPLDGEKIFKSILPYGVQEWLENNSNILSMIFVVLWVTGLLSRIVAPVIYVVYSGMFRIARLLTFWL